MSKDFAVRWTPDQDHQLRVLVEAGIFSKAQIAPALGRTRDAVDGRQRYLRDLQNEEALSQEAPKNREPAVGITAADLIAWGKTLCLPHRSDVEWRVWQLATTLELAITALERSLPPPESRRTSHEQSPPSQNRRRHLQRAANQGRRRRLHRRHRSPPTRTRPH